MLRGLSAAVLAAAFAWAPASAAIIYQQSGQADARLGNFLLGPSFPRGSGTYRLNIATDQPTVFGTDLYIHVVYDLFCGPERTFCGGNDRDIYPQFSPEKNGLSASLTYTLLPPREVPYGSGIVQSYHGDELRGSAIYVGSSINYELTLSAVPEPATWAMMIAGFGLVGATLRRRYGLAPLALR